jgi:glycine/D-amino acid oxidase-like deaminating enzyme
MCPARAGTGDAARSIEVSSGRVTGARTKDGLTGADAVVFAAGARARGSERRERIWFRAAEAVDAVLFVGLLRHPRPAASACARDDPWRQ